MTGKKSVRFNVFDVLIILVALACVAAIIVRAKFISGDTLDEKITIGFIVPGVMKSTADKMTADLTEGAKLYLSSTDEEIGYIVSIGSEKSTVYAENESGEIKRVEHPNSMNVTGVCVLYGKTGTDGFLIGGTTAATLSEVIYVYSDTIDFSMTITNVSEASAK